MYYFTCDGARLMVVMVTVMVMVMMVKVMVKVILHHGVLPFK